MKGFLWGLVIVIIIAALGFGGWYYFVKKSSGSIGVYIELPTAALSFHIGPSPLFALV